MSYKLNDELASPMLAGAKAQLDAGFLHFFAGTVPDAPNDALNMTTTHTLVAKFSKDGDGVTGLTFAAPTTAALVKTALELWKSTAAFSGKDSAQPQLLPTFFRFCKAADNGQGAGTTARLQGTIGATGSGADMERSNPVIVNGALVEIANFTARLGSIG